MSTEIVARVIGGQRFVAIKFDGLPDGFVDARRSELLVVSWTTVQSPNPLARISHDACRTARVMGKK